MCGIFGISQHPEAVNLTYLGLYSLQHRGEEAAGIAFSDGHHVRALKNTGLVSEALSEKELTGLRGVSAIGHCRYSTTGSSTIKNVQPFLARHKGRAIAVAHNGNLTNTEQLYKSLEDAGSIFQTSMDSEIIIHLFAKVRTEDIYESFIEVLGQLEGAFSLIFLVDDFIVGARDSHGVRPLCLGRIDQSYVLASETCTFDIIGAQFVREIEPGEIVFIKGDSLESRFLPGREGKKKAQCIFEYIYFARPDSHIFDGNVYLAREALGRQLARECPAPDADFVMAIPDSGSYAGLGYAQELGKPYEIGMIRNHYIGRTFIQPRQLLRDFLVRLKLNPIRDVVEGKKIVVVEDSIVRGTTCKGRVKAIRRAGAKEIHMRISCPPILWPCFYGIDFPSRTELIAAQKSVKEIADFIEADSLEYLSLEGMLSVVPHPERFCHACFSGQYPIPVPRQQGKDLMEGENRGAVKF